MSTSFFANKIMRNCDTYFPAEKFQQGHGSSSIQISYFYWWRQHLRLLLFPLFEKILDAKSRLPKSTSGLKQKCAQSPKLFLGTVKYSFTWFLHLTLQTKWVTSCERVWKTVPKNGVKLCAILVEVNCAFGKMWSVKCYKLEHLIRCFVLGKVFPLSNFQWMRKVFVPPSLFLKKIRFFFRGNNCITRASHRKSISPTIWWWLSMLPKTPGIKFFCNSDAISDLQASP